MEKYEEDFENNHPFYPFQPLKKSEVRDFEEYNKTQEDYYKRVDTENEEKKKTQEERKLKELREKPKISAKSRELAQSMVNYDLPVHERLTSPKTDIRERKFKSELMYNEDPNKKQVDFSKTNPQALTEKLFEDSKKRQYAYQVNKKVHSKHNEVVRKSKINNFSNFYKDFSRTLLTLFNDIECDLTREDFAEVLKAMGFTYFTLTEMKEIVNDENSNKLVRLRAQEEKVNFENSWKILTLNEEMESVSSNQVLVFLAAMCGNYSVEDKNKSREHSSMNRSSKGGKSQSKTNKTKSSATKPVNVFQEVLPNFDYNRYKYPPEIISKIRTCFFYLINNRNSFVCLIKKDKHLEGSRYVPPSLDFTISKYTSPQFDQDWKKKYIEKWRLRLTEFYAKVGEKIDIESMTDDQIFTQINIASKRFSFKKS